MSNVTEERSDSPRARDMTGPGSPAALTAPVKKRQSKKTRAVVVAFVLVFAFGLLDLERRCENRTTNETTRHLRQVAAFLGEWCGQIAIVVVVLTVVGKGLSAASLAFIAGYSLFLVGVAATLFGNDPLLLNAGLCVVILVQLARSPIDLNSAISDFVTNKPRSRVEAYMKALALILCFMTVVAEISYFGGFWLVRASHAFRIA